MATIKFNRNTSKDTMLYIIPPTVYTDSTTLTAGMTLYDNTGTDTGCVVGNISNNSFDRCITLTLEKYNHAGAWIFPENITVNSQTFTNATSPLEVLIPVGVQSIITLTCSSSSYELCIADSSGTELISGFSSINYSFTPTDNCTYKVARCIEIS